MLYSRAPRQVFRESRFFFFLLFLSVFFPTSHLRLSGRAVFCFLPFPFLVFFFFPFFFFSLPRAQPTFSLFSLFPFFFSRLCRQTHEHISASLGDRRDHDSRNDERPQRRMQTVSVRVFFGVSVTRLPSLYFCFHRGVGAA